MGRELYGICSTMCDDGLQQLIPNHPANSLLVNKPFVPADMLIR